VLDARGRMAVPRVVLATPRPCPPRALLARVVALADGLPACGRVSVGFPGVVRRGRVVTAPHFKDRAWTGFPLAAALTRALRQPVRVLNDAEVQGWGAVRGKGLELVVTLGTGVGTALFQDGRATPHLELAHHPVHGSLTYNEYIGDRALKSCGVRRWNLRVRRILGILHDLMRYDRLYVGGGNARHLSFRLPRMIRISNDAGLRGGIALWRSPGLAP